MANREVRTVGKVERRVAGEGEPKKLAGYASVFNTPTEIYGFMEQVAPGAFTAAIGRDDVRALFNHDPNYVLARTTNATLTLAEDARGLSFEAQPIDTAWSRDLMTSIERGDISQCSIAFNAVREEWDMSGEMPLRTILEMELFDISAVTYPAFEDTTVAVRSLEVWRQEHAPVPDIIVPNIAPIAARLRMRHGLNARRLRA